MTHAKNHHVTRCATCGTVLHGPFCSACGEKVLNEHDLTLRHFLEHLFEAFTHADGKIFKTLRALVTQPGQLVAEYLAGRRKPYLAPLAVFLAVNTLFFLVMPRLGWNTVTTPFEVQMHRVLFSPVVRSVVAHRLAATGEDQTAYAARFDHLTGPLAHSCVLLLVPLFSLPVWVLFRRQQRQYVGHLVFSLYFCAFWLLFMLGSLGLTNTLLFYGGFRPSAQTLDNAITLAGAAVMAVYLFQATRRVYPGPLWLRAIQAAALVVSLRLVLDGYRLLLFFATYLLT